MAAVGLVMGLGVLFFGTPDQAAGVPAAGMLVSAVVALAGTIYLGAARPQMPAARKSRSMLATVGFGILVVIALFLLGFFLTNH